MVMSLRSLGSPGLYYVLTFLRKNPIPAPYPFSTTTPFLCSSRLSLTIELLHSRVFPSSFPSRQISSSALAAPADNYTIVERESVSESEGIKEVKENLKVNVRLVGNRKANSKERDTVLSRLHSLFAVPCKPRNKARKKKEFNARVESTTTEFGWNGKASEQMNQPLHSRVFPPADNHNIVEPESVSESLPHSYISENSDSVNTKSEGIKEVKENLKVNVRLVGNPKTNSKERETVLSRLHSLFVVPHKPRNKARKKKEFKASVESTTIKFGWNGKSSERMNEKQQENSISDETKEVKGNTMNTKELVKNHKSNPNSGHLETKGNGRDRTVVKKTSSLHSLFVKPPKLSQLHTISERKEFNNSVESIYLAEKVSAQKGLSPEMVLFAKHLNNEGYLSKANFLQEGQLDLDRLSSNYARDFLKFAAEKFGIDHQYIAIWLSGSDMKKVSLVGCPSVVKRTVFAAKSLRSFFSIDEDSVCGPCKLKSSCKFISQTVNKKEKLDLADALRVLTAYATNSGPQQLILSSEVEDSINKLLKEVVNLSK